MPLFANNATLYQALQTLIPKKFGEDLMFQMMPVISQVEQAVLVDSRASYFGTTPGRAMGTGFGTVARESKGRVTIPTFGVGEDKPMDEEFMLKSRELGTFATALNLREEQGKDAEHVVDRLISRFQTDFWGLLTSAGMSYSITDNEGKVIGKDQYTFGTFTVNTAWNSVGSAVPLADLLRLKRQHRGQSATFGKGAMITFQSEDCEDLRNNTNGNDLGSRLKFIPGYGTKTLSLEDLNTIFDAMGLAKVVEYDEFVATSAASFNTGASTYNMLIPYQTGVCFGKRKYDDPLGCHVLVPTFGSSFLSERAGDVPDATKLSRAELKKNPWSNVYIDFRLDRENWRARTRIAAQKGIRVDFPSAIIQINTN